MRSISLVALAALSYATGVVAVDGLHPKYYYPRDVNRRLINATSASASSGTTNEVVIPIYVYVGADGVSTTVTGTPHTKTITNPVANTKPTLVAPGSPSSAPADPTPAPTSKPLANLGSDISNLLNPSTSPSVGTGSGLPSSIVQPTTAPAALSAATTGRGSSQASNTHGGNILSHLTASTGLLGGIVPTASASSSAPSITVGLSSVYSSPAIPKATSSAPLSASASPSTSAEGFLPSLLSSILPINHTHTHTHTTHTHTHTRTSANATLSTTSQESSVTGLPSLSIPISIPSLTLTSSTAVIPPASSSPAIPTATTTSRPLSGTSLTLQPSATALVSSAVIPPVASSQSSPAVPSRTSTSIASSKTSTSTATSTQTTQYIPPPVQTPTETSTGTTVSSSSGPTQLPNAISPPGGTPGTPQNSTLVQFGFNKALSWEVVATSPNWADQIYYYTPIGVAYALADSTSDVVNYWLGAYDTTSSSGYETTIIKFFIPSDQVDTLNSLRLLPSSNLYTQPSTPNDAPTYDKESIVNLFSMLNTDIPLVAQQPLGSTPSSATGSTPGSSESTGGGNSDNGTNPGDAGAASSNNVRASSVGIGVGAAAGAVAYAGVMFYVARRYRKRKQLHGRSSSVTTASMSDISGAPVFAQGARISHNSGRSGRAAMISAPVMSENSLGWN